MTLTHVMQVYDLLSSPSASGAAVEALLRRYGAEEVGLTPVAADRGKTDFVLTTFIVPSAWT